MLRRLRAPIRAIEMSAQYGRGGPKRFKLRQQRIRSCAAEPVAAEPKNPMVLCTFRLWSLAAPADRPGCRLSESVQVMPWTPQGVRTPSKRYAPRVLSPHLGHMQCNTIVAAPRKSNNEKPTFNFAMRIDVDQSYNPAKTITLNSAYVQRLDFCTEFPEGVRHPCR